MCWGAVQEGQDDQVAALLQALRWRLDHTSSSADRLQVLKAYIKNDILQLRSVSCHLQTASMHFLQFMRGLALAALDSAPKVAPQKSMSYELLSLYCAVCLLASLTAMDSCSKTINIEQVTTLGTLY